MVPREQGAAMAMRIYLVLAGAAGLVCLYSLTRLWADSALMDLAERPFVALFSFCAVFFAVSLVLAGPLPVRKSVAAAAGLAAVVAALVSWAGLRFAEASQALDHPATVVAVALIGLIAAPFLIVGLRDPARWSDYAALFDAAWAAVGRVAAGCIFVGSVWILLFLADALLNLVGLDLFDLVAALDWAPFALSGATFGLGVAVAMDLQHSVPERLVLRLLRMLLPVMLGVVALFLMALPFRGLQGLFGGLSAAATLMSVAAAAVGLISIALDRDDAAGIQARSMHATARVLAIFVPVLSALAAWAVALRVLQYGWTPDRVLAQTLTAVLLLYGVMYSIAAIQGRDWAASVRRGNTRMALVVLALSGVSMTPLLDPFRLSANSQLDRFLQERTPPAQLPLWQLHAEWGYAGRAALARIEAENARDPQPQLTARLQDVRTSQTGAEFDVKLGLARTRSAIAELVAMMPVRPAASVTLAPEIFEGVSGAQIARWLEGCKRRSSEGPGCVWLSAGLDPALDVAAQAVVFHLVGGEGAAARVAADYVILRYGVIDSALVSPLVSARRGRFDTLPRDTIARILRGDFTILDSGLKVIDLGGARFLPRW